VYRADRFHREPAEPVRFPTVRGTLPGAATREWQAGGKQKPKEVFCRAAPQARLGEKARVRDETHQSLFGWLVTDGWCWFVLREEYLLAGGWFGLREKYCWQVADKPSEQAENHARIFVFTTPHLVID
jgi:hypothetical protein